MDLAGKTFDGWSKSCRQGFELVRPRRIVLDDNGLTHFSFLLRYRRCGLAVIACAERLPVFHFTLSISSIHKKEKAVAQVKSGPGKQLIVSRHFDLQ
jgi:hypothetical protein